MGTDDNFGLSILLVHGEFVLFHFVCFTNWMNDFLKFVYTQERHLAFKDCNCVCVFLNVK